MPPEPLPRLLDVAAIARETGVSRTVAQKIMRHVPVIKPDGIRKTYARRDDVLRYIEKYEQHSERRANLEDAA